VDARVDIYSLGVIGYEMLTLRRPFEGASPTEVWHKATHERPVPLGVHRPGLPPALASTIMKAMASAPGDRFATAGEVRAELAPFLRAAR
jgi:serine/threonine-protein kinase